MTLEDALRAIEREKKRVKESKEPDMAPEEAKDFEERCRSQEFEPIIINDK